MKTNKQTALTLALGSAISLSLTATPASAADSPFAAQALEKGYMVAEAGKAKEGKCGGDKAKEAKCGAKKKSAEDEAANKKMLKEGKCGEGKCGGKK